MKMVNGRYRIVELLHQSRTYSVYEAMDMMQGIVRVKLCILNTTHIEQRLLEFCISEFERINYIDKTTTVNILDFGVVVNLDNKNNKENYYYTTEWIGEYKPLLDFVEDISEEALINTFSEVCKLAYSQSYSYHKIMPLKVESIYVTQDFKVKLKDKITTLLEYREIGIANYYEHDEDVIEGVASKSTETSYYIEKLAEILVNIVLKNKRKYRDNKTCKSIIRCINKTDNSKYKHLFGNKIHELLCELCNNSEENRYNNILDIIDHINDLYGKDYKYKVNDELENISFNIPIIGRNEEIKAILTSINNIEKYHESKNIILVHGEIGIGKSRLIDHIKYRINIEENKDGKNINCIHIKSNKEDSTKLIINQLLRQIVSVADKSLVNKYKKDLINFVPDMYGEEKQEGCKLHGLNSKSRFILIAKISSFLQEYYSENPGIIIADDMNIYDDFTLGVIQYILNKTTVGSNIIGILSYRDGDCLNNSKFTEIIEQITNKVNLNIHLRPLSEDKAGQVLKNILNLQNISEEFMNMFYKYSRGNPLFIEEALKDLSARKVIYMDKDTGIWNKIDDHEIFMSTNMEDVCKNQLKELDKVFYNVLYNMSFFYMPISVDILKELIGIDEKVIINIVEELVSKGILYSSISDNGFVYTFYNRFLKNYLYRSVDDYEKENVHNKISEILIKYCARDFNIYIEETIYHLEIIGDKERLIYYYKKNEERLESINNSNESIRCNLKILDIIDNLEDKDKVTKDQIEANMRLGNLYNKLSEKIISLRYYDNAIKLCSKVNEVIKSIDIMVEMVSIYIDLNKNEEVDYYTSEIAKALKKVDYITGKIKYLRIQSINLFKNQEYEKLKKLSNYGMSICKEDHIDYMVIFSNMYCNALISQSKVQEALDITKKTIKNCYENNYVSGLIRAYNNIGVIYADYIQSGEEALAWFVKIYNLNKDGNNRSFDVTAGSNIGFINYVLLNYDEAYKYLIESSNKAIEEQLVYMNFYNYVYIGSVLFKQGKYLECFRYVELCNNYIEVNSDYGQDLAPYYTLLYYVNSLLADSEKAKEYLLKGKKVFDGSDSLMNHKLELLHMISSVYSNENLITVDNVISVSEKILYIDLRISMLAEGAIQLINKGQKNKAKKLYEYMNKLRKYVKSNTNKLTLDYIGCKLHAGISFTDLEKSISLYKDVKNPTIMWRVYSTIGYFYYNNSNYSYAARYLVEACDMIVEILIQIPRHNKKAFLRKEKYMIECFEMLLDIKSYYNHKISSEPISIDIETTENIEELFQIILESDFINDDFIKSLRNYSDYELRAIDNIEDLLNSLCGNSQDSMELICKYISHITLASKAMVIIENDNKFSVITSNAEEKELPEDMTVVNISRNKGMPIMVNRGLIKDANGNVLSYDVESPIKSSMCVPITQIVENINRVSKYDYEHDVLGYIYVECDRKLNNINKDSINKCITIGKILYMIIDKLNVKASSTIDKLTNTLTRKYLEIFIHEQIDRVSNLGGEFSTIMVDIDKFKSINDTFGHRTGDQVLSKLCNEIIKNIRKDDVIGRYGGEEFIIVLPNTGIEEAETIAERIRIKIYEAKIMGDKRDVTVSLGIANYPNHTNIYEELIEKSDQALYVAKNSGRNITRVWNESYGSKISTTNRLSGIFVGNGNQDYKNVSTVIEFIDLINAETEIEEKFMIIINRIAEITESDLCTLFQVNEGELTNIYSKVVGQGSDVVGGLYNYDRIKSSIALGENICGVDWDYVQEYEEIKDIPDLKSNMVVLLKDKTKIIGVIYLSVSITHKEFTYDELNFVNTLAKIMVPILSNKE
ncbi:diguanylate cyclase [Clostridium sp.]|uniref:diguanylate cyclase n=1 Tax=Clostridium sp. TaxID=1506 RepID=UPI003216D702